MPGQLEGRRIIITGGAAGIGLSTARALLREGAAVALLDLDGAAAEASARSLASDGGRAFGFGCDVTEAASVDRAAGAAREALGGIDGLFNNAGIADFGSVHNSTPESWQRIWAVNVTGSMLMSRAVLPASVCRPRGRWCVKAPWWRCSTWMARRRRRRRARWPATVAKRSAWPAT